MDAWKVPRAFWEGTKNVFRKICKRQVHFETLTQNEQSRCFYKDLAEGRKKLLSFA